MAKLAGALAQAGRWAEAEQVIGSLSNEGGWRGRALARLARALAQAERWPEAERLIGFILDKGQRKEASRNLADALVKHNEQERLLSLVHHWWRQANTGDEALELLPRAFGFIPHYPDIGMAFCDAFAWVDNFLRG